MTEPASPSGSGQALQPRDYKRPLARPGMFFCYSRGNPSQMGSVALSSAGWATILCGTRDHVAHKMSAGVLHRGDRVGGAEPPLPAFQLLRRLAVATASPRRCRGPRHGLPPRWDAWMPLNFPPDGVWRYTP